ncbi:hypothetical protein P22_2378 [Propionispora sp. 2/2-37]|uniref:GerMN domain-containing protein n=1 Tax=Propionispora sp. 2/2-37 TaxID=1677858 RepID=UPI0006BB6B84|nr:GerMN domain-containing protein [Propionispora sp. 2/2-37]CUH96288.1 hypothetical protein P22_2378 [Propionispora sp. 2/2-37]
MNARTLREFLLALLLSMLTLLLVTGCSEQTTSGNITEPAEQTTAAASEEQISPDNHPAGQKNTIQIVIYQATKDAKYLVPEVHVVPLNAHPARTAIELLIAGTKNKDLVAVMPPDTQLRSLSIKDHTAYVDFSSQLIKNNQGGSASEMLLVGAVVNTLTEFPEIDKVRFLVEGKLIDTINGHMDISQPLSRSESMIKKN